MEDRIKKVWEEIKDKPIEYTLQKIAELEDKLEEKEPDMLIMASRQNGKTIATKIKLKELQNETAIKELKKARNKIKSIPYKDFGIIYKSDVISVLDKQLEKLSN